jgi:hypothetical protein
MPIARRKVLGGHPIILEIARAEKVAKNLESYRLSIED